MGSTQDIWEAVQRLSPGQLLKLREFARLRMRGLGHKARGRNADDLLSEAIVATASGDRVWKEGVDFYVYLLGAIRSISSKWRNKQGEEYLESELLRSEEESPLDTLAPTPDPERILRAKETIQRIRDLFNKDEAAARLIDLLGEGYTAKEIQSQLGISQREFGATVKRIHRKLDSVILDLSFTRRRRIARRQLKRSNKVQPLRTLGI